MAEVSYPTQGGGGVTDARYEQLIGGVMPSGLIGTTALSSLVFGDSSGRQVKVQPSRGAIVRGFRWETDGAGITRSIAANTSGNPRIDLAVLRLNRTDYSVTFQVIQGSPSASPVAPAITQNTGSTGVWEMPLAQIAVANNASTITAANVTNVSWYVGGPNLVGTSVAFPTVTPGSTFTATDTGKRYEAIGSEWRLGGEQATMFAYKPTGENLASSTTLQNDDDLSAAVVANAIYEVRMLLRVASQLANDFKIGFTGPAGYAWNYAAMGILVAGTGFGDDQMTLFDQAAVPTFGGLGGTPAPLYIAGLLWIGPTAGTFRLQWAQGTSSASITTLLASSYMALNRVA